MCVCNISVCLWKMQYRPPKSYLLHFPSCAFPEQEAREWMRKDGVCFLFSSCPLCELEHVSDSAMWVLRVRDAVSPAVFAERQRKWFACFVYRLWAFSTSARADVGMWLCLGSLRQTELSSRLSLGWAALANISKWTKQGYYLSEAHQNEMFFSVQIERQTCFLN